MSKPVKAVDDKANDNDDKETVMPSDHKADDDSPSPAMEALEKMTESLSGLAGVVESMQADLKAQGERMGAIQRSIDIPHVNNESNKMESHDTDNGESGISTLFE